jgi:hypothetical protein
MAVGVLVRLPEGMVTGAKTRIPCANSVLAPFTLNRACSVSGGRVDAAARDAPPPAVSGSARGHARRAYSKREG